MNKYLRIIPSNGKDKEYHTSPPYDHEIEVRGDFSKSFKELVSGIDSKELDEVDFIIIDTTLNKACTFINDNPVLKNKKVLFYCDTSLNSLKRFIKFFNDDTDFLYIKIEENDFIISYKEYYDTVMTLERIKNEVNLFDFSTLEKIMYVYDIVRDKVYKDVSDNEDKRIPRSLSSSLLGDKIVCVGYSKVFSAILDRLGIKSKLVYLTHKKNDESGHVRNEVYVKDDKYNIDGVYYFDITYDNKKGENDNSYLNSYEDFAITKKASMSSDCNILEDMDFPFFSPNLVKIVERYIDNYGYRKIPKKTVKSINYMSKKIYGIPTLVDYDLVPEGMNIPDLNKEDVLNSIAFLVKKFNTPISANVLLQVLYNVRKNQYYINPEKYPFDLYVLFEIADNSNWKLDYSPEFSKKLKSCKDDGEKSLLINTEIHRFLKETDIYRGIFRVQLTKTLKLVYDKKTIKDSD